jgi:hypothetical protein
MRKSDHEQLLTQILDGGNLDALRAASLARGLDALRHRRRRRQRVDILAAVIVPLLVIYALHRHSTPSMRTALQSASPPPAVLPAVKYITAQELFALFPDRAIALIGKPGRQQVVFLDEIARAEAP